MSTVNYIEVETSILRRDAESFQEQLSAAESALKSMFQEIQTLNSMWKGAANQVFNAQFTRDYSTMEELTGIMKQYAESLQYAASEYEACENRVQEVVRTLR